MVEFTTQMANTATCRNSTHTDVDEEVDIPPVNTTESPGIGLQHLIDVTRFSKLSKLLAVTAYLIQNSQAVKKQCGPQKGYGEKRCKIQGGGQEMAVMVGLW